MKKYYLWIFIVIFLLVTFWLRADLVVVYQYHKISDTPEQTTVTTAQLLTSGTGSSKVYFVQFNYHVNGKNYSIKSLGTNKKGADSYMTNDKYKSITYAKNAPEMAMLTAHYQLRQQEQLAQVVFTVLITSVLIALILTLVLVLLVFLIKKAFFRK